MKPIFIEIDTDFQVIADHLAHIPGTIFLDSCGDGYSYLSFSPFMVMYAKNNQMIFQFDDGHTEKIEGDPFRTLQAYLKRWRLETCEGMPSFQGGICGYFGYDLLHQLESIGFPLVRDEISNPDMILGFYDTVLARDHKSEKTYLISTGLPGDSEGVRRQEARKKATVLAQSFTQIPKRKTTSPPAIVWQHKWSKDDFIHSVKRTIRYIEEGDIYQANISMSYLGALSKDFHPYDYYQKMKIKNPAPFSAFVNFDDVYVLSASPERFIKIRNDQVLTSPIKGTRPRGKTKQQDKDFLKELLESDKDRAENLMIVDLLRNDLAKVCRPHSIKVKEFASPNSFAKVHHLISHVEGHLNPDMDAVDVLRAVFPGGSITGVPKVRAMQIISELEQYGRGVYCGSIGYISFNGDADLSIAIRTLEAKGTKIKTSAGCGITALSNPDEEYEEALSKLQGLLI